MAPAITAHQSDACELAHNWFAVQVKSGREASVDTILSYKGYETFLPKYKVRRQWSDRVKLAEVPFFPGYVFCRLNESNCGKIVTSPGVVRIVGTRQCPTPVSDLEIESVRKVAAQPELAQPWPYAQTGQAVIVKAGPLRGVVGNVIAFKSGYRIIVSIHVLQRSVSAELDTAAVEPVPQARRSAGLGQIQ